MRAIEIEGCEVSVEMEPEDMQLEGNVSCIDPDTDAEAVRYVRAQLEAGNDWAWCQVVVRVRYRGLEATDALCGCSYASEADFRAGGYYDDMVYECLASLNRQARELCKGLCS